MALAALGSSLVYRGATGHCAAYGAMGVNTAGNSNAALQARHSIKVEESVTVNRSPAEVYRFWRRLENLPRFMDHLESVTATDDRRSARFVVLPFKGNVEDEPVRKLLSRRDEPVFLLQVEVDIGVADTGTRRIDNDYAQNGHDRL